MPWRRWAARAGAGPEMGEVGVRRYRVWVDRAVSLVTVLVGLVAAYVLVTERLIPALRGEPAPVDVGGRLPSALELERLAERRDGNGSRERIRVPGERATLLLLFNSTCPACYANLSAWGRVVASAEGVASVLAVAMEVDRGAARGYVRRYLPTTVAVVPKDARELAGVLGVGIVPATALVDPDGVLRYIRQGSLDASAVDSLLSALRALKGPSH
ncbi:MAG: hypothetical protein JSV86_21215 [Gemmatimonadota bacterium]|nr:MAG: hypothetical protein JSV86_21215 [Gemmatimonadota bacterium]